VRCTLAQSTVPRAASLAGPNEKGAIHRPEGTQVAPSTDEITFLVRQGASGSRHMSDVLQPTTACNYSMNHAHATAVQGNCVTPYSPHDVRMAESHPWIRLDSPTVSPSVRHIGMRMERRARPQCYILVAPFPMETAHRGHARVHPQFGRNAMSHPESRRIAAALEQRAGSQANADQLADAVVMLWREINDTLTPIIGARGLAALHGRSLYLTSREYAWLNDAHGKSMLTEIDFDELRRNFTTQPMLESRAAAGVLLHTFHDLLASLVGAVLTERLLHAIWNNPFDGHAAQDVSE